MNYSELEYLKIHELNLFALEQKLKSGILKLEDLEDFMKDKGSVTINNELTTHVEWIALHPKLQDNLNYYPLEIPVEKTFDYLRREDIERFLPRFTAFFEANDAQSVCTDFQGLREMQKDGEYNTLISSTKIYEGKLLTLHAPLKSLGVIAPKIEKALELDHFMRNNYEKFASLTKTEKEILGLIASGYSSQEIADMKFISVATANTHRRNLKRKLEVKHFRELLRFAQAFDLV